MYVKICDRLLIKEVTIKSMRMQYFIEIDSENGNLSIGELYFSSENKIKKKYFQQKINDYSELKPLWKSSKNPLFYIHGYFSATKGIIKRTAIGFHNFIKDQNASVDAVVHIIWDARTIDYFKHYKIIEKTKAYLAQLLNQLSHESSTGQIQLMCHSMGNKLFLETIKTSVLKPKSISYLILSAPDISISEFKENMDTYLIAADQIIILTHKYDRILAASSLLNRKKRLGLHPKIALPSKSFKVLNCTHVSNEQNLLSKINKHFYFVSSQEVRNQLHAILNNSLS